ncbi:hypothetical protein NIES37_23330 [Tolypothrix tenuis PCC 7101]|uniref:Uncharacterized protein n=1 Tax=Tolypothrix tenuis PCC 7101 TaxID=231146 RepID=A0A1Z4MY48_9CYAN|nr:hypothetical protein NIES37_23330 [Tolypothrix tenuis PCC 7101]BAZ77698.1 hypothetical protein NIES50_63290 [Aulosira laxa NIES-50]
MLNKYSLSLSDEVNLLMLDIYVSKSTQKTSMIHEVLKKLF